MRIYIKMLNKISFIKWRKKGKHYNQRSSYLGKCFESFYSDFYHFFIVFSFFFFFSLFADILINSTKNTLHFNIHKNIKSIVYNLFLSFCNKKTPQKLGRYKVNMSIAITQRVVRLEWSFYSPLGGGSVLLVSFIFLDGKRQKQYKCTCL